MVTEKQSTVPCGISESSAIQFSIRYIQGTDKTKWEQLKVIYELSISISVFKSNVMLETSERVR